jgi:hypothetical protein
MHAVRIPWITLPHTGHAPPRAAGVQAWHRQPLGRAAGAAAARTVASGSYPAIAGSTADVPQCAQDHTMPASQERGGREVGRAKNAVAEGMTADRK